MAEAGVLLDVFDPTLTFFRIKALPFEVVLVIAILASSSVLLWLTVIYFVRIASFSRFYSCMVRFSIFYRRDLMLIAWYVLLKIITKSTGLISRVEIVFLMILHVGTIKRCTASHSLIITDLRNVGWLLTSCNQLRSTFPLTFVAISVLITSQYLPHLLPLIKCDHFSLALLSTFVIVRVYVKVSLIFLVFINFKDLSCP